MRRHSVVGERALGLTAQRLVAVTGRLVRLRDDARVDFYEGVGDVNTGGRRRKKSSGRVRSGSVWVRRKKRLRCYPRGVAAQPRIPKNRRSDPRGVGSLACTRTDCLFVSRSVCQRWLTPGRHGLTSASLSRPKTRCRSVFVLVAFPPPPVYVLDNEAQPKLSGVRYPQG